MCHTLVDGSAVDVAGLLGIKRRNEAWKTMERKNRITPYLIALPVLMVFFFFAAALAQQEGPTRVSARILPTADGRTSNDGEEFLAAPVGTSPEFVQGTVATYTRTIDFTRDFGSELAIGLRFEDLDIPPGATIVSAFIRFNPSFGGGGEVAGDANPLSLVIKGQRDVDPPAFIDAKIDPAVRNDITRRPTTIVTVPWDNVPVWTKDAPREDRETPNLAPLVQEIVNLRGWSSNSNAIVFIFSRKSGNGIRRAADRRRADESENERRAPLLVIEYQ